jgi:RNA 3'-terminal phosphate cyclase (ATP)
VRYAVALAALLREPIRVINVRHSRTQPGLRPQHVASVRACAQLAGAVTDGVEVDSREFTFTPGERIWEVPSSGTSGRPGPQRCSP